MDHCAPALQAVLAEPHKVIVPMGATALRAVLGYPRGRGKDKIRVEDFHGAPTKDSFGRWVVSTFHPAYLLGGRGGGKFTKTVTFDLSVAKELAAGEWSYDKPELVIDPEPAWLEAWVTRYLEALHSDPESVLLSVDVETSDKGKKSDEGELNREDQSWEILYLNLSCSPDEGVTFPWVEPYIGLARRALEAGGVLVGWNCPTPDQRVLTADLRWVPSGDLRVGDELIGFDEEAPNYKGGRRRFKTSKVTHAERRRGLVYSVDLSDGTSVKVTGEHPWLAKPTWGSDATRRRIWQWINTKDLRVGMPIQRLFSTWETGTTREHGYLAGFFDGEGCYTLQGATGTAVIGASQNVGPTLDYVNSLLDKYHDRMKFKNYSVKRPKDYKIRHIKLLGRVADAAMFLGEVRPVRLLPKFKPEHLGSIQARRDQDITIVAVRCLGEQEIVGLSTSTRTYVLEGFGAHNCTYDVPRLKKAGVQIEWANCRDAMDAWHVFQSHLPRGLGFVAPHYSRAAPWKHLGNLNGVYRAMDGVQTTRCAYGILRDLEAEGMGHVFHRHCYLLDTYCLRPAEEIGLPVNKPELVKWRDWVRGIAVEKDAEIRALVPEHLRPMDGPYVKQVEGWTHEKEEEHLVQVCERCKEEEVSKKHRCEDLKGGGKGGPNPEVPGDAPRVVLASRTVKRYYRQEAFNPGSWQQVLTYILWKKHKPGRNKKTGGDSTDKKTLERLRKTKDPFYSLLLERRGADKMAGTYGDSLLEKLKEDSRVHATFLHVPSTLRLSCADPNLTNLGHHVKYAPEFRRTIEAAPGCRLRTYDFAAIEAVLTGWKCQDPKFIKLAKLGIHAHLTGIAVGQPASEGWSDADKLAHYSELKKSFDKEYDRSKRCVYLTLYGGTAATMTDQYPETFPTRKVAEVTQGLLFEMLPSLARFHAEVRKQADRATFLGGPSGHAVGSAGFEKDVLQGGKHPFGYKHYFYDVLAWTKGAGGKWRESLGPDGKSVVAMFPQSIAAAVLYEAMLRLFVPGESENWIGDAFYGATPLRALIHDEAVLEVPEEEGERVHAAVMAEMGKGIPELPCPAEWGLGSCLKIGVAAKVGKNWGAFQGDERKGRVNLEGLVSVTAEQDIAGEEFWREEEEEG